MKAIAKVKPKRLYISQDGPRDEHEKQLVLQTRKAVLKYIDWDCELTTWFNSSNLGLKKHIPGALTKFFAKEDFGIYLEDDTLPSEQFFYFQKELLERYKNNNKVFAIKGVNLYPELTKTRYSYFLSQIGGCWGLGMWRRSWKFYKSNLDDLNKFKYSDYKDFVFDKKFFHRLKFFLKLVNSNTLNTWDYQLTYSAMKNRMYFITSSLNLVENIGMNTGGSNIFLASYKFKLDRVKRKNIIHPIKLTYKEKLDKEYFNKMYKFTYLRLILNELYYFLPIALRSIIGETVNKIKLF